MQKVTLCSDRKEQILQALKEQRTEITFNLSKLLNHYSNLIELGTTTFKTSEDYQLFKEYVYAYHDANWPLYGFLEEGGFR